MSTTKTRISAGDIQRTLKISRWELDRLLRDFGKEAPDWEVVAGVRLWPSDALPKLREILLRDQEGRGVKAVKR